MRAANPVKEVRHIGLMGEELAAFLNTLKTIEPKQFGAIEKALHTLIPNVDGIEVEMSDLGEVELRLKENGVAIPARVLSEGTLRMLGLLALTGAKDALALVGFEEPENGVHPRRVQLVAELLKTRARLGQPSTSSPRTRRCCPISCRTTRCLLFSDSRDKPVSSHSAPGDHWRAGVGSILRSTSNSRNYPSQNAS
jgi:predicted ATPase